MRPFGPDFYFIGSLRLKGDLVKMALKPEVKKNWIEVQKRYSYPVNAIGVRIDSKDKATLKVWTEEGIDQFVKA
jgi:hypothetical protein